ncbi:MAG: ribonuclease P protein component [Acidimicrobiales bacterium]
MIAPVRGGSTFSALQAARLRARRGCVTVRLVPGPAVDGVRVAYGVGRQVGGAVDRNRVRRRLRAIVHHVGATLTPGAYLIGAGRQALSLPSRELESLVSTALHEVTASVTKAGVTGPSPR